MTTESEKAESAQDGLDLVQLMNQIAKDAEKRKRDSLKNGASIFYRQLTTLGVEGLPDASPPPDLKLQPDLTKRERYQLNDLLGFHDEAFIKNAYKAILKREPDDAGLAEYLQHLRSGRYSKLDIVRSLRFSIEGETAKVPIEGLGRLGALRKLYRVPVAGYLLRLAVAVFRLPVLIINHRQLESHTAAQLERIASHFNEAIANLSDVSRKQAEAGSKQIAALQEVRNGLTAQIDSLISEQEKLTEEVRQAQSDLRNELVAHSDEQWRVLKASFDERFGELEQSFGRQHDELIQRIQHSRMEIAQQGSRITRLLDSSLAPDSVSTKLDEEDQSLDLLYYLLEDALRGTPEEIKEESKVYLPVLNEAGISSGILDVGCGRGEWLEVLKEAGLQAKGIDSNHILVERCRSLSLDVSEAEALIHLRSLAENTLNAVTAFHFAEHLHIKTLVRFFDEVCRTLNPGGVFILETPNPENLLVGSCNFYLDPTHKHPIPIQTLKLILEARGFQIQDVMKLHPVKDVKIEVKDQLTSHLNHFLYGPMNYAVVARKPEIQ